MYSSDQQDQPTQHGLLRSTDETHCERLGLPVSELATHSQGESATLDSEPMNPPAATLSASSPVGDILGSIEGGWLTGGTSPSLGGAIAEVTNATLPRNDSAWDMNMFPHQRPVDLAPEQSRGRPPPQPDPRHQLAKLNADLLEITPVAKHQHNQQPARPGLWIMLVPKVIGYSTFLKT